MILHGVVGSGQGLASLWLQDALFARLLGTPIYAGSINVFVRAAAAMELGSSNAHPFFRPEADEPVNPDDIRRNGCMRVRDCTLNGHRAFLLRTENPGKAYGGPGRVIEPPIAQPNTMFEIVATTKIDGMVWGATATVEFNPDPAGLRCLSV